MSRALYNPLADNDEATRISAATQLAAELANILAGERTDETKNEVDYALKRLTRGLSSGRESARPGFSLALSEFTKLLQSGGNPKKWTITFDDILQSVLKNTHPGGGLSKQEERGYHFGRLFGLQALLVSGVCHTSLQILTEYYNAVLKELLALARRKPWMGEFCAHALVTTIQSAPAKTSTDAARLTYEALVEEDFAKTSDGVAVWLELLVRCPDAQPPPKAPWKGGPLAIGNLPALAKVLREAGEQDEEGKVRSKGSWNQKLPFVWKTITRIYLDDDGEGPYAQLRQKSDLASWSTFWSIVVDEGLFAAAASDERKFWGFSFFCSTLPLVSHRSHLEAMFSRNFMRCLINQLSDSSRVLHKAAHKAVRALVTTAASPTRKWVAPTAVRALVRGPAGTPNFDQITHTKTVANLVLEADADGLVELMILIDEIVRDPVPDLEKSDADAVRMAEVRRRWAADHVVAAVRSGKTPKSYPEQWVNHAVCGLTRYGYFDIADAAPPVSSGSQEMFRARLQGALAALVGSTDAENLAKWPLLAVTSIQGWRSDSTTPWQFAIELDEEIEKIVEKAVKTLQRAGRKEGKEGKGAEEQRQLHAFELLLSLVVLLVYNGEPDALELLEELLALHKKLAKLSKSEKGTKGSSKKRKHTEEEEESGEEMQPGEVLLEMLLSLLSKPSKLFRTLAHHVLTAFLPTIASGSLQPIYDVLETKEGLQGQQELFDKEDEDDDVEMLDGDAESGSDAEEDSDVEVVDADEMESSDSDSSVSTPSSDDEEENEDDEALQALDADLAAILQTGIPDPAASDSDSSDSGPEMDDEQMFALDNVLAQKLRQYKNTKSKKAQKKEATEMIVTFKSRCLELLGLLVKHASSVAVLEVLPHVVKLCQDTADPKLASAAAGVVRDAKKSRVELKDDGDAERAEEALDELCELAGGLQSKQAQQAASSAALVCVKALVAKGGRDAEVAVAERYAACLIRWTQEGGYNPGPGFFTDAVQWIAQRKAGGQEKGTGTGKKEEEEKEGKEKKASGKRKAEEKDDDEEASEDSEEEDVAESEESKPNVANGGSKKKRKRTGKGKNKNKKAKKPKSGKN